MGIRSRRRSRSTAPPPPPSSSSMSSPWEEGRPSTRIRYAEQHRHHPRRPSSTPHSSDTPAFYGLTDDLIVEILSRVPAKSLSRFKCVSKHWLNLIGHPDHRKRLAQPLAGFFYNSNNQNRFPRTALHFFNASGSGRPLFYPSSSASISQTAAMASCSVTGRTPEATTYTLCAIPPRSSGWRCRPTSTPARPATAQWAGRAWGLTRPYLRTSMCFYCWGLQRSHLVKVEYLC
ncbi:hypothetical protein ACQ4PT_011042 [Festuca glaucescens]